MERKEPKTQDDADDEELSDDDVIRELYDAVPVDEEEEEGEDLFGSDMEKDYEPRPELDTYGEEGMWKEGDEELIRLAPSARRKAELMMEKRDKKRKQRMYHFYNSKLKSRSDFFIRRGNHEASCITIPCR